jgi:hypothetical protein
MGSGRIGLPGQLLFARRHLDTSEQGSSFGSVTRLRLSSTLSFFKLLPDW